MRLQCSLEIMDNKKSPPRSRAERPNGFDCVGVQYRMDGIEDSSHWKFPFRNVVMIPMTGAQQNPVVFKELGRSFP